MSKSLQGVTIAYDKTGRQFGEVFQSQLPGGSKRDKGAQIPNTLTKFSFHYRTRLLYITRLHLGQLEDE